MRIEQLEYVAAVTQHGSLRRASEALHISQPALSEAVSKLERELGVTLLDRRRSGARISRQGLDLLQSMTDVLDAVDQLKRAADAQHAITRTVRIGTVNAATSTLLAPAVRALESSAADISVEVLNVQQDEIQQRLIEGSMDLGLVNVLAGDEPMLNLIGTDLLRGRPVAVLASDHPLAEQDEVTVDQLRAESFVAMRAGYVMHRFAHRLFGSEMPRTCHTTDGAEMGKFMVSEGLGITMLPDYSVTGDPLERAGLITTRPIAGDTTQVTLVLQRRKAAQMAGAVEELHATLVHYAREASSPAA